MTHKSLFISIEGIDESETMAQLDFLAKKLQKNGHQVLSINFPKYSEPSAYFINQLNQNKFGKKTDVGPYTSSIFYAIDRYSSLKEINDALDNNQVVIVSNFTASTGAKEGSIFTDIGEFNDYLMWHKAVENRMFGIPAPDISIVLDPENSRIQQISFDPDIVRRNFDHIISINPDKFRLISQKRENKILSEDEIKNIIAEIIKPLLPEPDIKDAHLEKKTISPNDTEQNSHIVIENVSKYLVSKIQAYNFSPKINSEFNDLKFYSPNLKNEESKQKYDNFNQEIAKIYKKIIKKLEESVLPKKKIELLSQDILPLSTLTNISIPNDSLSVKALVNTLDKINEPEAERLLKKLISEFNLEKPNNNPKNRSSSKLNSLISNSYGVADEPNAKLVNVYPRNEIDLITEFLYSSAVTPITQIKSEVDNWTYDNKSSVLRLYLNSHLTNCDGLDCELENTLYNLELITTHKTLSKILSQKNFKKLSFQTVSPRLGYKISDEIKKLNLDEDFEESFDLSLVVFSELQVLEENDYLEYCCLQGNKLRLKLVVNVHQIANLYKYLISINEPDLGQSIIEQISLNHPIVAESIK